MTKYARSPAAAWTGAATAGKVAVATIRQAARTRTRALRTIHSTRRKAQNPSRTFHLPADIPYESPGDTPRSAARSVELAGCAPVAEMVLTAPLARKAAPDGASPPTEGLGQHLTRKALPNAQIVRRR